MTEYGTEVHVGNQITESRFKDVLFNFRHDHAQLPQAIIDEMKRYVDRYPDLRYVRLCNIRFANWTVEELDALLR